MSDSDTRSISDILQSRESFTAESLRPDARPEPSAVEATTRIGRCRISRRPQMMIAFRQCSGKVSVLPYTMLTGIDSDDTSRQLTLIFPRSKFTIEGERLTPLYHYLCEHRVMEFVEADRSEAMEEPSDTIVTAIRIQT